MINGKIVWISLGVMMMAAFISQPARAGEGEYEGTAIDKPAFSYYLVQGIIDTYRTRFGIADRFDRRPISDTLKTRNVYHRAVAALEEFATLFPDTISPGRIDGFRAINPNHATSNEVAYILILMRDALREDGFFNEYLNFRTSKTPSDVYQIMRKLGWFHREIAHHQGLEITWDKVDRVYETVVRDFMPTIYRLADEREIPYQSYPFPEQPVADVMPYNIYKLILVIYENVLTTRSEAWLQQNAVRFAPINDCDVITPAEVFDMEQVVAAEFRALFPQEWLSHLIEQRYLEWRSEREALVSGHTFRLLQHLYGITKALGRGTDL